jgi:hypothetical protein
MKFSIFSKIYWENGQSWSRSRTKIYLLRNYNNDLILQEKDKFNLQHFFIYDDPDPGINFRIRDKTAGSATLPNCL